MNVLSLFDGMSCGQIALNKIGIKVDNYFASEIDKYAIQVTQKNYPNTKQIGSVVDVKGEDLPKIDLLFGGSPCQSFSRAGDGSGFDGKSKLFFEFIRILKETNPKYFLLENVVMKKEWEEVITNIIGVKPVRINSSLVSAQNRDRLYWTNIPNISLPNNKGLVLDDILEDIDFSNEYPNYLNGFYGKKQRKTMVKENTEKARCLSASMYKGQICSFVKKVKNIDLMYETKNYWQMDSSGKNHKSQQDRIRKIEKPSNTLSAGSASIPKVFVEEKEYLYRKLTPIECERLQTVPENYTDFVSNTQRYKMLGNGWTVDVITHIFKNLK